MVHRWCGSPTTSSWLWHLQRHTHFPCILIGEIEALFTFCWVVGCWLIWPSDLLLDLSFAVWSFGSVSFGRPFMFRDKQTGLQNTKYKLIKRYGTKKRPLMSWRQPHNKQQTTCQVAAKRRYGQQAVSRSTYWMIHRYERVWWLVGLAFSPTTGKKVTRALLLCFVGRRFSCAPMYLYPILSENYAFCFVDKVYCCLQAALMLMLAKFDMVYSPDTRYQGTL